MKLEGEQILLRVWLRNTDKHGWQPAAQALVERARHEHLAGATLLRGLCGVDVGGQVLESGRWSLVDHVPVIVEFIDSREKIGHFLSMVEEIVPEGLATLERAHVMVYRHNPVAAAGARLRLDLPSPIADLSTVPSAEEFPAMQMSEDGQQLRIFIGEADVWQGQPLYKAIVHKVKELGLAGATVLHGAMGFGATSRVHTSNLVELSTDLPILIEIIDTADKIQTLLPFLDESVQEGLITVESVRVLKYLHREHKVRG